MIDIQEPVIPSYTLEEKAKLKQKFILLLHTLLLVYLSLHNLIIPLVMNSIKNQPLLQDVHWWFLFQIPVQWLLRSGKNIPRQYLYFLIIGSILRVVFEVYTATNLKSWFIFSVFLSEISSGIFYVVYFPLAKKIAMMSVLPFLIIAVAIIPILNHFELKSEAIISFKNDNVEQLQRDGSSLGCKGSDLQINFPLANKFKILNSVVITTNCGFAENIISPAAEFTILNSTPQVLNLRLYRLQALYGKIKWKFQRLIQVNVNEYWSIKDLIKLDAIYLIKIPETRRLGHLVLVPIGFEKFPLGDGHLILNYDSLNWIPLK